jgi:predicted amidohydrolase YtcJ
VPDGSDSVVVEDGRIVGIGRAERPAISGVEEHRHEGFIVPGMVDAHLHPLGYAAALMRLTLDGAAGIQDVVERVAAAAAALPPGRSLVGSRLDDQALTERRMPTRHDLDRAAAQRPVLIYRYCGHVAVANTAALDLAGVTPDTADPPGGRLDRDEDGTPTGVLRETAVRLVAGAVGGRTADLEPAEVLAAMHGLSSIGLTAIGAIIDLTGDLWCGVGNELELLLEIAQDLPLRMEVLAITDDPVKLEDAAARLDDAGPMVGFLGVKQFADGSFGGHTAAMYEPFADRADERGTLRLNDSTEAMSRVALRLGGKVAIHAIGDRATGEVIGLFESLLDGGADAADLRIEHVSVITARDLARLAATGATAVIQPAFLMSEAGWLAERLGCARLPNTYAFRDLLEAGVPLAGSSDCPVEPPSPWWGMAAARDRAGVVPEQSLEPEEAFHLFTDGGGRAIGHAPWGEGNPADFLIIDRDPLAAGPDELRRTRVRAVFVGGERIALPATPVVWST